MLQNLTYLFSSSHMAIIQVNEKIRLKRKTVQISTKNKNGLRNQNTFLNGERTKRNKAK